MANDYFIMTDDGHKFCRRFEDENGNVRFETKQGCLTLQSFQEQAFNPKLALQNRGKRQHNKNQRAM